MAAVTLPHPPVNLTIEQVIENVQAWFIDGGNDFGYDADEESCRYRADLTASCPDRCAVGVLIPDELYEMLETSGNALEGNNVTAISWHLVNAKIISKELIPQLQQLQHIHDGYAMAQDLDGFLKRLRNLTPADLK